MVDNFKMKSTETNTCIDFGDGFVDCTAGLRLVAAVSIEKRAGRCPAYQDKRQTGLYSRCGAAFEGQTLVFGQNQIRAYSSAQVSPCSATI